MLFVVFGLFLSYLAGSIPIGFLLGRYFGVDIRAAGSGNIGATNVSRLLGRRIGAIVLSLDFLKGAIPVLVFRQLDLETWAPVAAGLLAVMGHIFPVWLRFRGGKGVATGFGVVAVLLPIPSLVGLLLWLTTVSATRYVSLASILGGIGLTGTHLVQTAEPFTGPKRILTLFCLVALGLVIVRHIANLTRLWRGNESQIEETAAMKLLNRVLHVLALGLWFGSSVFFTFVAAALIFKTLEGYGTMPRYDRPTWLPFREFFDKDSGTRLAGATVSPMFLAYFIIQGICGLVSLISALGFTRSEPGRRVHRWRFIIITAAVVTVIAGWPLNQYISGLRLQRYDPEPSISAPAKESFGRWHTYALFLNFATVGLVTVAMGMAASLPSSEPKKP
jgi:acyl-phosphate glycerol 3-phosphate acyltransferase